MIFFALISLSFSKIALASNDGDVNTFEGYEFMMCNKCLNFYDFERVAFRKTPGDVIVVNMKTKEVYTFSITFEKGQQLTALIDNPEGTRSAIDLAFELNMKLEELNSDLPDYQ